MKHDELVEKVAIAAGISRHDARIVIAAIYDALKKPSEAMRTALHDTVRIEVRPASRDAEILNDCETFAAMLSASPLTPETNSNG